MSLPSRPVPFALRDLTHPSRVHRLAEVTFLGRSSTQLRPGVDMHFHRADDVSSVSRVHCHIRVEGQDAVGWEIWVVDEDSQYGTDLDGVALIPRVRARAHVGMVLRLGPKVLLQVERKSLTTPVGPNETKALAAITPDMPGALRVAPFLKLPDSVKVLAAENADWKKEWRTLGGTDAEAESMEKNVDRDTEPEWQKDLKRRQAAGLTRGVEEGPVHEGWYGSVREKTIPGESEEDTSTGNTGFRPARALGNRLREEVAAAQAGWISVKVASLEQFNALRRCLSWFDLVRYLWELHQHLAPAAVLQAVPQDASGCPCCDVLMVCTEAAEPALRGDARSLRSTSRCTFSCDTYFEMDRFNVNVVLAQVVGPGQVFKMRVCRNPSVVGGVLARERQIAEAGGSRVDMPMFEH